MSITKCIFSIIVSVSIISCSPQMNKKFSESWRNNTTKKRMNYIVQKILIGELEKDIVYLSDTLLLRDYENKIPYVSYGNTMPERHFEFKKPERLSNRFVLLKLKNKLKKKIQRVSSEQIENKDGYFVWYYISPVIKIEDFNKNYYNIDLNEYDSFVQIIINIKAPNTAELGKGNPTYIYVSNLYILKSNNKGDILKHRLVWEGS